MKKNLLMAGSVLAVLLIGAPDRLVSAKLRETLSAQAQKPPSRDRKERLMKALKELNNPDPDTRQSAVEHLGQMGDMSVVEPLASSLADAHPEVRAQAEKSMWLIWLRSGEPETDKILYLGMELIAAGQLQNAIHAFTRVIERAPNFAEGYNKRATAFYLAGQFEKSIVDCDATIRMNPHHFGALFGKGLNYVRLNDLSKALEAFRKTLRVLPYSESAKNMAEAIERKIKSGGTEL